MAKVEDAKLRALLDTVGALHGITVLRSDAGFYISEGYFEPSKERARRHESDALILELHDAAVGLVDAFGIPDACLAAPIAFMDPAHPAWWRPARKSAVGARTAPGAFISHRSESLGEVTLVKLADDVIA